MRKKPILIVDDEPEIRRVLTEGLSQNGYSVHAADNAENALKLFERQPFALVIADIRLPDKSGLHLLEWIKTKSGITPVIMMTGYGSVQSAVESMKKGAYDYILKPFSLKVLEGTIESAIHCSQAQMQEPYLSEPSPAFPPLVTRNEKMKDLMGLCQKIAASKATVLIQGESGTGKEIFAKYIHACSQRGQGPFIAVNCASLPETLLESELFGHEKGAFTGAIGRKIGKFELAHGGTILLDEISEMNTFLQAKILRVLQENEVDRIGGNRPVPLDMRVIATTNRDIEACVDKGEFREDLFYRLNVISLKLPALRERPDDIELLADHFMKKFAADYGRTVDSISGETLDWLKNQEWRGNVRELKNTIERAVLMANGKILQVTDFSPHPSGTREEGHSVAIESLCLREMERNLISKALEKTEGNRTNAAKILGISIRTLRNKLNEYKQEFLLGDRL
jgi:DNA-binding NtrC family response regulator